MWLAESHHFRNRITSRMIASGQQSYKGRSCRTYKPTHRASHPRKSESSCIVFYVTIHWFHVKNVWNESSKCKCLGDSQDHNKWKSYVEKAKTLEDWSCSAWIRKKKYIGLLYIQLKCILWFICEWLKSQCVWFCTGLLMTCSKNV